ncbi:MAG: GPP34 family phosphoprotein [Candidatus Cloacimonadaceae bacterium]|nr:GPP34 family phosphoprotein [Candidatus Cloacimonadaceae bacterium]MDP3114894.1 GPP34 family phosphoprotein [Candidatus Cloacimonadaceae bacterium]
MLNCAEELILIAIDDESGDFHRMTSLNFNLALVGALLADLGLKERIDVSENYLHIVGEGHTGDQVLDNVLDVLKDCETPCDTGKLIRYLFNTMDKLKENLLASLEQKGIVACRESKFLWLFNKRRYPVIDNREEIEALTHIRKAVLTDDPPDPKDLALIALIDICDLMDKIFSKEELHARAERIEILRNLDYIGHAVHKILNDVQIMIASAFVT